LHQTQAVTERNLFDTFAVLPMLQDLVRHKWHANASLIAAIQQHRPAACDDQLRKLLHHILVANRFWLMLSLEKPFAIETEMRVPDAIEGVVSRYIETSSTELEWISRTSAADLERRLETPHIPGYTFSVAEGVMQICMHSHGHRAQCSTRLRALGGTPPNMDFVLWLKGRPAAQWSAA
jgi:uncharacterized damage-inducible protein DinB